MARGGDAGSDPFAAALVLEGITDPRQIAYLRSIHGQESGGGKNTKTSNRGAVGGMQILPDTFKSVADAGMDIKDPVDNARAGIRYAMQGYKAAQGNPALAATYYYGGPAGLEKAKQGVAVSDPKNPNNPNTLEYGKSVAKRMTDLLPISSAQAAPVEKDDSSGIASLAYTPAVALGGAAGAGLGATGMRMGDKLGQILRPSSRLGIAAPGMGAAAGVGAAGAGLSTGAANALSNATPEQLEQLQGDIGSDTGLAAAIMNPRNRGEEVTKAQMPYGQQMANVAKTLVGHPDVYNKPSEEAPPTGGMGIGSHEDLMHMEHGQQNALGAQETKDIVSAAKETVDPETSKGWTKDDWLTFGLAALATESPNFLQGIGQAGLATQKQRQARQQQEIGQQLTQAQIEKLKADTDYLKEQKGQNALRMKALALANDEFNKWQATVGLAATEEEKDAARKKITAYHLQQMGVTPATMGGTGIAGFKFLGAES